MSSIRRWAKRNPGISTIIAFIRASDGTWHLFGITHQEPADPDHEIFFLHATAPDVKGPWKKQAPVMHIDPAFRETVVWAPHVVAHDGKYWMFYCAGGKDHEQFHIHLATSPDLVNWTRHPANPMIVDGYDARDPMVLQDGDQWILYYCATETPKGGNHVVKAVTSPDLVHWSAPRIVFRSPEKGTFGGPTKSPFVVPRNGKYYLFVCTNEPYNTSAAYVSDNAFSLRSGQYGDDLSRPWRGSRPVRTSAGTSPAAAGSRAGSISPISTGTIMPDDRACRLTHCPDNSRNWKRAHDHRRWR